MNRKTKTALLAGACLAWCSGAHAAGVTVANYGVTADGKTVKAYTLTNDKGASATVLDYGGAVAAINVPDRAGHLDNVVMSFNDMKGWEAAHHVNSLIGRFANVIRGGFTLDGVFYPLRGANGQTMHGGVDFYAARILTVEPIKKEDGAAVTMDLDSPDGDQGFPGHLKVKLAYRFTNDNTLRMDVDADTDKDTVVNFTNHIYFNLNGNSTTPVYRELLQVNADRQPAWADGADKDKINPVAGTLADWQKPTPIGERLKAIEAVTPANPNRNQNPNNAAPPPGALRTYNISLIIPDGQNTLAHSAVRLSDPENGRVLDLRTTETTVQVFVPGSERPDNLAAGGKPFSVGPAVALETQHLPDSPNHPTWPTTELKPGQHFHTTTSYGFSVAGKS